MATGNVEEAGFNRAGLRKPTYALSDAARDYLVRYGRHAMLPLTYADLARYDGLMPVRGADGRESLWSEALYRPSDVEELHERLVGTYQLLIADGRPIDHLRIAGIHLCPYGNSRPFRVKVLNQINDNHDYFYVKRTDASRVYGLELEHLLSPNRINFLYRDDTLIEEHIIGVPGDTFMAAPTQHGGPLNTVRLSKEFVKFNERCFVRLLGDMRAYNFVVDVIHDLDQVQYRLRSIDFDQQCFEGRMRMYLPQFFKENLPFVQLAQRSISIESVEQYRNEERALLRKRRKLAGEQFDDLLSIMALDALSTPENLAELANGLAEHHRDTALRSCTSMGQLLAVHIEHALEDR